LPDILAALIAIAGWYYLFYSSAAGRLRIIEPEPANTLRLRLRKINGVLLVALAALLYIGFHAVNPDREPRKFIYVWLAVMLLLLLTLVLGMVDLRLTWKLRRQRQSDRDKL